ncbi:hypothetical protein ABN072_02215 [Providencia rettgeri]|uniref:hypothetical protein n=1 Tax=Providencia rettgeri TaxID=587 RepID=UPI0032DA1EE3
MKKIMITALLALFLSGCDNSPPAPYGFKWGQSMEEVKALNLKDTTCYSSSCFFKQTPDKNNNFTTMAIFDDKKGLFYISHVDDLNIEGITRKEVLQRFEVASKKLEEKFGKPINSVSKIDDEINFVACLEEQNCSDISQEYDNENGYNARLKLKSIKGQIYIETEYGRKIN